MKLLKMIFIFSLFSIFLNASMIIKPDAKMSTSGGVTDIVISKNRLFASTVNGTVDIFDLNTKEFIKKISVPKTVDFTGEEINAKVYSVDVLNNKILILAQGKKGGRNIYLYEDNKLTQIISDKKRLFISKAKFIDKNKIIYSLLSNQFFLYNLSTNKNIYERQISQSRFSDFSLNDDKSKVILADESGILHEYEVSNGKFIRNFKNQNLDNVYQVDWKKDTIITAGQDRRSVVYNETTQNVYYKQSDFLVYSCGLSPNSHYAGYSSDELNTVTIFNTLTQTAMYKLIGNKMLITNIVFLNDNEIFVSSDDSKINYYKIKE
ncbi:WD40 repeat domain-containing protein [Arcobacter sp. CECT 8985]|uniref:WD40 repeat domain-containing protein n=1 Tax=Arcobacter sp. CECT 8985 TaxID=1935424 RepID=UPI00100AA20C|nr:WD40 repeat domain-containing protein [Arcobacter sp. CECT 8985]RXJ86274.1 hypothetical protein CRU93_09440 [Arcobacter sp. CECT 8985]